MGRDIDQIRVHCEMCKTAAVCEHRLAGIAVGHVLPNCLLDCLAGERVLQFGGKYWYAVQEKHKVDVLLVLLAVAELAYNGEEICRMQALCFLVESACGTEVCKAEFAPRIF